MSRQINFQAIACAKIATGAITASKIAAGSVTTSKLTACVVSTGMLNAGTAAYPYFNEEPPERGFAPSEIIAFRCWRLCITPHRMFLRSLFLPTKWNPGEIITGNLKEGGIHAWKTKEQTYQYIQTESSNIVIGKVALWGEVIEHELGYRAENAEIISIDEITPETTLTNLHLQTLRRKYGLTGVAEWPL